MRIVWFDPYSGASGDMVLGAFLDAGLSIGDLNEVLRGLRLPGWELRSEGASQHGIHGTRVRVIVEGDPEPRDWSAIRDLLVRADLPDPVRAAALAMFRSLAEVEAQIHGTSVDRVHFHEVGGVDAIVDIVGTAAALHLMGIERVYSGPPALGRGFAQSQHGTIPIPAPATAALLARSGAPSIDADVQAELLTPTGATILTTLAEFERPAFRSTAVGYGFGQRELPWPNALRIWLGEMVTDETGDAAPGLDTELLIEANIDDMNPEFYELLLERLFAAGALDAYLTPIVMKRGRPAVIVSAIIASERRGAIEDVLFDNSSTFGVRATAIDRTRAGRAWVSVATRWGDVRLKLKFWHERVVEATPEYADCLEIARSADAPLRLVYGEAQRMGDAFVGRKSADFADGDALAQQ
ncbi:MAG: nickel pincer cofactor biosynthesis protein LarC [Thermomicrobiales bacterium]|nr:nickel pincer cofactor biosynthesis protein LarC [Thermomicrobiales bacterium]